jgi:hypothetical protein
MKNKRNIFIYISFIVECKVNGSFDFLNKFVQVLMLNC